MNSFIRFLSRRLLSTSSNLGAEIKQLNDNGEFQKAIDLYEDQIKKQNKQNNGFVVSQALKACLELDDIKRAKDILKNLSSIVASNHYIQTNIIRLHSKLFH